MRSGAGHVVVIHFEYVNCLFRLRLANGGPVGGGR